MTLHFINVGQAAAAIVEFPENCGALLIDAGVGPGFKGALARYVDTFFADRPALGRTFRGLYITHPHQDHMAGLDELGLGSAPFHPTVTVENLVDDGFVSAAHTRWDELQASLGRWIATKQGASHHQSVHFARRPVAGGYKSAAIDPLTCAGAQVRVLWGGSDAPSFSDAKNPNNQSLVIRLDYGASSALITGDLMRPAIAELLDQYGAEPGGLLDVDLYVPGHHGADNGTTEDLLAAVTPTVAVMEVGDLSVGAGAKTAWGYGHPRIATIEALEGAVSCEDRERSYGLATTDKQPAPGEIYDVDTPCHIYATGWNGNVQVELPFDGGAIRVYRQCELLSKDALKPERLEAHRVCIANAN